MCWLFHVVVAVEDILWVYFKEIWPPPFRLKRQWEIWWDHHKLNSDEIEQSGVRSKIPQLGPIPGREARNTCIAMKLPRYSGSGGSGRWPGTGTKIHFHFQETIAVSLIPPEQKVPGWMQRMGSKHPIGPITWEWQRVAASYFHAFTWFCTRVDKSEAVWNSMDENTRCVKVCMVVKYWLSHTLAQNCLIELWSGSHLTCKNTLTRWTWIWYGIYIGNEHRLWQQK